jgi:hypothetical protein
MELVEGFENPLNETLSSFEILNMKNGEVVDLMIAAPPGTQGNTGQGRFLTWFKREQEARVQNGHPAFNIIFNIKVVNEPSPAIGNMIRRSIFQELRMNPPIEFISGGHQMIVAHVWESPMVNTSAYYCTYTPLQYATFVRTMKVWIQALVARIQNLVAPCIAELDPQPETPWSVAFLFTRPVKYGSSDGGHPNAADMADDSD